MFRFVCSTFTHCLKFSLRSVDISKTYARKRKKLFFYEPGCLKRLKNHVVFSQIILIGLCR